MYSFKWIHDWYLDDLDFILIEDVALLNYDLGIGLLKQRLSDLPWWYWLGTIILSMLDVRY